MTTDTELSELEKIELTEESLRQRIESLFTSVIVGPAQAYVDVPKKNGSSERMHYRTIHFGGSKLLPVITEIELLLKHLRLLSPRSATLIWRIVPAIEKHGQHWTVRMRLLIPELNWNSDEVKSLFKKEGEPYKVLRPLRPKAFASMYG